MSTSSWSRRLLNRPEAEYCEARAYAGTAANPRRRDLLHLRRRRRPPARGGGAVLGGHALSLALQADDQRTAAVAPLVGQDRVLLGRFLHEEPARRRAGAGRALDPPRALRRRRDAGPVRRTEPGHGADRVQPGAR